MLTFFRRIRKGLLEGGATSKYLLYAIGEILLVVIGILIALYLNDLKDRNNEMSIKKYYAKAIKADLEQDQILINEVIDTVQSKLAIIEDQIRRIYSTSATMDTLVKIARYEFDETNFGMTYNDNSLKSLVATGNLTLFETHFTELLLDLEKAQREESEWRNSISSMAQDRVNAYQLIYTRPYKDLPEDNLIDRILWEDIDEKDFTGKIRGVIFLKRYRDREFIKRLEVNKQKTTFLIDFINSNYGSLN